MELNHAHGITILIFSLSITAHFFRAAANGNSHVPCKPGWYFLGEKCYKIFHHGPGLSWSKSRDSCKEEGGNLASIHSAEVQESLTTFLLFNAKSDSWIGLHDRIKESEFSWDDGSTYDYKNWDRNEPTKNFYNGEDCVEMRYRKFTSKIGTWNDVSCDSSKSYICQADINNDVKSQDPRFCSLEDGGGWKYLNSCYHIIHAEKSWEHAEKYCEEKHKGFLVSILEDKAEEFLNYIMKVSNFSKPIWIGIKMRNESTQNWASGWHVSGKKINQEQLHFVDGTCFMKSTMNSWVVAPCINKYAFICEKMKYNMPVLQKPPSHHWKCPESSKKLLDFGGDSCYYIETKSSKKWFEANYACGKHGGTLVSLLSENETNILHPHVIDTQERLLIGLSRTSEYGDAFEWADGEKVSYENWDKGEPNSREEKCGEMWTETMKWNDIPCNIAKGYICKTKKVYVHPKTDEVYDSGCDLAVSKHRKHKGTVPMGTMVGIVVCSLLAGLFIGVIVYHYQDYWKRIFTKSDKKGFTPIPGSSLGNVSDKVLWKAQE